MNSHSRWFKNAYFNERKLCRTAGEWLITQDGLASKLSMCPEDMPCHGMLLAIP